MKNILLHASITELTNVAVEQFISNHRDDSIILIYEMLETCSFNPQIPNEKMLLTDKMRNHYFRGLDGFYDYEPLDKSFLGDMSVYEGEIYKMMDTYFPPLKSFDERQRVYFDALRFFRGLLLTNKIDLYIQFGVPHQVYDYVIYCLCKCLGIRTYLIYRMPIRGYIYFFNSLEEHGHFIGKLRDNKVLPSAFEESYSAYTKTNDGVKLYYMPSKSIKDQFGIFSNRVKQFLNYDNRMNNLAVVFRLEKRKKRIDKLIKTVESAPNLQSKFLYVGLHYQPEGTTSPMAGVFCNQQLIIEMLSYYVPDDVYIYVKEHPNQNIRGEKNESFYSDISRLRNVKIIPTEYSSNSLTKNCIAVVTCTGTVAYEASYLGKNVLLFGNYLYNYLPNCKTINNNTDLINALQEICGQQTSNSKDAIKKFLLDISNIGYHAEFATGEKAYMLRSGWTLEENNREISNLLEDIYKIESV